LLQDSIDSISADISRFEPGEHYSTVDVYGKPISLVLPGSKENSQPYIVFAESYLSMAMALGQSDEVPTYVVRVEGSMPQHIEKRQCINKSIDVISDDTLYE
jgi:hypothetical protein